MLLLVESTEGDLPRGEVEMVLGDCVAGLVGCRGREGRRCVKALAGRWPGVLLRCWIEELGGWG